MRNGPEMGGMPDGWSVNLAVEDAQATADGATAHGGQVLMPPMEVPEVGIMGTLTDPGQAVIGFWQPKPHQGFGIFGEPGTPGWFELHTRDYAPTLKFYEDVFGWDTYVASDEPDFRYTTLGEGENGLAGVMDVSGFLPAGVPSHWSVYFQVDDADAALKQIGELGGSTVVPAEDTPYGRSGTATDSGGVQFKLLQNL